MHTTTLSFVGDIFLSGDYRHVPEARQLCMFDGLKPGLQGSDLVFGNFEGVVLEDEPSGLAPDKIRMAIAPAYLKALRQAGVDVLSLSNNHVFDYGASAFQSSRGALERAGFTVFGAGLTDDEALTLVVRQTGGLAVGFLGFTCATTHPAAIGTNAFGVGLRQRPDVAARVAQARRECDLLVVSLHWGEEHVAWPSPEQLKVARALIDAGADVIAGHHAHVFQGVERYRHGVIAYGLGGVSISALRQRVVWRGVAQDYHFEPEPRHRRAVVMSVQVRDRRIAAVNLTPVVIDRDGRPCAIVGARLPLLHRLAHLIWHMPGYALFFRAVLFTQFRLKPRLRWLADGSAWRRLMRG